MGETPVDHMARALPRALPPQVRGQLARFGLDADRADTPVGQPVGRREGAAAAGAGDAGCAATADPGRADQPSGHRRAGGAGAGAGRLQGAVLLITHDPHLVELVADRLWLVADGTVQAV